MKRLFTLAVLLSSSLAGAVDGVADLENKYYAGLNFGAGWGGGIKMKPGIVFGYHCDKNSKFELEILTNIQSLKSIGASLMANYRFYPDLDIDPVKLYVSGGLGGYVQVIPFGFGGGGADAGKTKGDGEAASGTIVGADIADAKASSIVDKILGSISYKLKLGIDYEFTPQIVGAVGIIAGGQLIGLKALTIPDAVLEVGVRYNF